MYLHEQDPAVRRPEKELKAFNKIALAPGEEKVVTFKLSKRDFAYYDTDLHDWNVRSGKFCVFVGRSSRDLPLKETIEVQATTQTVGPKLTRNSMLKDFKNHPKGKAFYPQLLEASGMDIPSESDAPSPEEAPEKEAAPVCDGLPG